VTIPTTYGACRAAFEAAFNSLGARTAATLTTHRLDDTGPDGEELAIQVVALGDQPASSARRALVVMSGVHGVEGFIGSALQVDLLSRWDEAAVPADVMVLLIHAVNPWGMAWGRRQNEHNVDLNRNWRRSATAPTHNDAYDELHPHACPDTDDMPAVERLFEVTTKMIDQRGESWVRDAITKGQYRHPDGLHFGGDVTEPSTAIVERTITEVLGGVDALLTIDLHTGEGPMGEVTLLSAEAVGSQRDDFVRRHFAPWQIRSAADSAAAVGSTVKNGHIASGFGDVLAEALCIAATVEFGTASDIAQLVATYHEQWVYRRGDRRVPEHAAASAAYRACFTPDDPAWSAKALADGRRLLDDALAAVGSLPVRR
jgi:predicted deacylase